MGANKPAVPAKLDLKSIAPTGRSYQLFAPRKKGIGGKLFALSLRLFCVPTAIFTIIQTFQSDPFED